jgi:hypothetical protein
MVARGCGFITSPWRQSSGWTSVGVLCDKATIREGLLHILGGGVRVLGRPQLPASFDVDLALMLEPETLEEFQGSHDLVITILTEDQDPVMLGGFSYEIPIQ